MKKLLLYVTVLSCTTSLNAQVWMKDVHKANPNFFDIQKAFYETSKDKNEDKEVLGEADGENEKFKRWEWYWEQRVGKNGEFPKSDVLLTELKIYNDTHSDKKMRSPTSAANWSFKGPSTSAGAYHGIGRVSCIAFHPTDPQTFWVGTPAGGLWKTTDAGSTWSTNTDNLPVLGISDIAINPTNPNIMYIATGDGDNVYAYGDTKSVGVLKSTNGGVTWSATGLNLSVASQILIRRLLIDPTNSNILIAATSNGIYRTTNAGSTWTQYQSGKWFIDMEFKTTDHNYVYASTYDFGGNAQIYTSTNNGITWTQVTSFTDYSRINLAVSANQDVEVDALCTSALSTDLGGLGGLWYSVNNGASFTQYFAGDCTNNLLNIAFDASGCKGQGNYDLAYAMNPTDINEIWLGGVNTWRTADAGASWNLNNVWSASATTTVPEVHADKHFIAFHPLNPSYVYECNDGGLYVTNNGGTNWYDLTNGMGISEIYRIGTSATLANDVICGLQDNGSKELYNGTWYDQTGGDGMECIIDNTNPNIAYATYVEGKIYKTTDGWATQNAIVQNSGTAGTVNEPGEWVTPYIMNPTNNNILLVGKSQVYKTTNGGTTWSQLGTISGISGNIISMAYAPSNTNTIYVASAYELFMTTNGGSTWNQINTSTDRITYIAVDPANSQSVYITFSGYTAGHKVSMSSNGGTSWVNYSGTLPNIPVNCIVYQNGTNEGLYIGTDLGVYYTNATMSDWISYNTGLPNVVVNELEISYINNKLWAGTFGRGLWNSDLYTSSTGIEEHISGSEINIFPNPNNGHFTIQVPENKPYVIEVYNILGEKVLEEKQNNNAQRIIDLSNVNSGIYFVHFLIDSQTVVKKIVINKY